MADPTLQTREEFEREVENTTHDLPLTRYASGPYELARTAIAFEFYQKGRKAGRASALREAANVQCVGCRENWKTQGSAVPRFHVDPKSGGIIVCNSGLILALLGETEEKG